MSYTTFETILSCILTAYFLQNIPIAAACLINICMTLVLSNLCILTMAAQSASFFFYLQTRFHHLNSLLEQLLFDKSWQKSTVMVTRHGLRVTVNNSKTFIDRRESSSKIVHIEKEEITVDDGKSALKEFGDDAFSLNIKNIFEMGSKT